MFGHRKKSVEAKPDEYGAAIRSAIHGVFQLQLKKCKRVHCHDEKASVFVE